MFAPDLSIIIPTLDEEQSIQHLLNDLNGQEEIELEVLVSDGGSVDKTFQVVEYFFQHASLNGRLLQGPSGRGRQLNGGVAFADSEWLLFLHADSRLTSKLQLREALDRLVSYQEDQQTSLVAGRFKLRFDLAGDDYSFGYYFYESKAALGRSGCIHGDQGMLLARSFFQDIGPFREDLPVMEDTLLANRINEVGQWLLLPGIIKTSARRFQSEGLQVRQTLNALMMNFLEIGWLDFFAKAPEVYRQQRQTEKLQLLPFFQLIIRLLKQMPFHRRLMLWFETGKYVRGQGWQLGWYLDCRKAYRQGQQQLDRPGVWLKRFDKWFEPLTNHWLGNALTAILVRLWFAIRLTRS